MVALHRDDVASPPRRGESSTARLSDKRRGGGAGNGEPAHATADRSALHVVDLDAEPPPRVRKDMLPDGADYEDTGCELAKSCLRCPFSRCKYDLIAGGRTLSGRDRDREMAILREKHNAPVALLAFAYGVSRRTVFRALLAHNGGLPKKSAALRRKREMKASARQLAMELDVAPRAGMTARRRRRRRAPKKTSNAPPPIRTDAVARIES
jgi:hypothetical protein